MTQLHHDPDAVSPARAELVTIPFAEYAACPALNASGIKHLIRSPAHYQASLVADDKDTPAKTFGRLLHAAILEPEKYNQHKLINPDCDRRTNAGKAQWLEFKATFTPDSLAVSAEDDEKIRRIADSVHGHKIARDLVSGGAAEQTYYWVDDGIAMKARFDYIAPSGFVVDIKTTLDAAKHSFSKTIWTYRYDIQAAHYCEAATHAGCAQADCYAWIAVEKEPPYAVAVYVASPAILVLGRNWRDAALATYATCSLTNHWPAYSEQAEEIDAPAWAHGVGL